MFLAQHPSDPSIFATATSTRVSLYQIQLEECIAPVLQRPPRHAGRSEGDDGYSDSLVPPLFRRQTAMGGQSPQHRHHQNPHSRASHPHLGGESGARCGPRMHPKQVVYLPQRTPGMLTPPAQPSSPAISRTTTTTTTTTTAAAPTTAAALLLSHHDPLTSLSLSCARDQTFFFVSDASGAGWVGASGSPDLSEVFLPVSSGHSSPRPGGTLGGRGIITTSAWDPRHAPILAVGRQDAVVQLADVEYLTGPRRDDKLGVEVTGATAATTPFSTAAAVSEQQPGIIAERHLDGAVTALDWLAQSHLTVVATRRLDSRGYSAALFDPRASEGSLLYLGAPPTVFSAPDSQGALSAASRAPCYADVVACCPTPHYVATAGGEHDKDVVQLWDVRMGNRPLTERVYAAAGYTSLCWSAAEPVRVLGTVQSGAVREHSFEEELLAAGHDGGAAAPAAANDSRAVDALFSVRARPVAAADRCRVPTHLAAAGVVWLQTAASELLLEEDVATSAPGVCTALETGVRADLPYMLLLSRQDGELYAHAYCRDGALVTMSGDTPIIAAGPNLFTVSVRGDDGMLHGLLAKSSAARRPPTPHGRPVSTSGSEADMAPLRLHSSGGGNKDRRLRGVASCSSSEQLDAEESDGSKTHADSVSTDGKEGDHHHHHHHHHRVPGKGHGHHHHRSAKVGRGGFDDGLGNSDDDDGDDDRGGLAGATALAGGPGGRSRRADPRHARPTNSKDGGSSSGLPVSLWDGAVLGEWPTPDRHAHCLSRAHCGFSADQREILQVLLEEGCDREAFALFRYGGLVTRLLFAPPEGPPAEGAVTTPLFKIVPGLLELATMERRAREQLALSQQLLGPTEGAARAAQAPPSPAAMPGWTGPGVVGGGGGGGGGRGGRGAQVLGGLRVLVLRAVGWMDEGEEEDPRAPPLEGRPVMEYFVPGDGLGLAHVQEAVERRVAVLCLLGRVREAAELLALYSTYHPLYPAIALEFSAAQLASPGTAGRKGGRSLGAQGCSRWLSLALFFVDAMLGLPSTTAATASPTTPPTDQKVNDTYQVSRLQVAEQQGLAHRLLLRAADLPLTDKIGLLAAVLLPSRYAEEHLRSFTSALHCFVHRQYDSGSGAHQRGCCSLFVTAAVEGIGASSGGLQRYVDETADVQSALCYVTLYGNTGSSTYKYWREAYSTWLNNAGLYFLRCQHDLTCIRAVQARTADSAPPVPAPSPFAAVGVGLPELAPAGAGLMPAPGILARPFGANFPTAARPPAKDAASHAHPEETGRTVELRCNCGQPMHATAPTRGVNPGAAAHVRREVGPCGNPECRQRQAPMCVVCGERMEARTMELSSDRFFIWCTVCLHGGHWCHVQDWFRKHHKCAVENCSCQCCEGVELEVGAAAEDDV